MIEVGEISCRAYAQKLVGTTVSVLLETEENGAWHGYTDTYVPVVVTGGKGGEILPVRIEYQENGVCYGIAL